MKSQRFILIAILVAAVLHAHAQNIPLSDFKKVPLPVLESEELYALNNRAGQEFAVSLVNGQLQIEKYKYEPVIYHTIPEGQLLGINQGEWGGGLYFKPKDTTISQIYVNGELRTRSTKADPFRGGLMIPERNPITKVIKGTFLIKGGNIRKIFVYKDSLYLMEGLAHMSISEGVINRLQMKGDSVKGSLVMKFDDAPSELAIYHDDIYLATRQRFYVVRNWKKELLLDNLFWSFLGQTSVAVKDLKHIYVGMRAGYALVDAEKKSIKFFQYQPK